MAETGVTLISSPSEWTSVYRPVEWVFSSSKSPNIEPFETASIVEIRQPTTIELAVYPTLAATDLIVLSTAFANIAVGDYITISGTNTGNYVGSFKVTKVPSANILAIDTTYVANEIGGEFVKLYRNYTLFAEVSYSSDPGKVVTLRLDVGPDGYFVADLQEVLRAAFDSPLDCVTLGGPVFLYPASGYVAQSYDITIKEGYDIPDAEGILTLTKNTEVLFAQKKYKVVNSVHPYVHLDQDGAADLEWTDGYDTAATTKGYVVSMASLYTVRRDFLTYAPRTSGLPFTTHDQASIRMGTDDEYFLAYLQSDATSGTNHFVRIRQYNSAGSLILNSLVSVSLPLHGGVIACGPKNIAESGIPLNGAFYRVDLYNANTTEGATKSVVITIDDTCGRAEHTFYWQNKLGGIDGFRAYGKVTQSNAVERSVQVNPYMAKTANDFNARVYAANIGRNYSMETQLLGPEETRWLADDMAESVDVREIVGSREKWARVIIQNGEVPASLGYTRRLSRMPITWTYGHDNRTHRG